MKIDIDSLSFPVQIKNNAGMWLVLGALWFSPTGHTSVKKAHFKGNIDKILPALEDGRLEIVEQSSDVQQPKEKVTEETTEEIAEDVASEEEEVLEQSVIEDFVEKRISWQKARRVIMEMDNLEELNNLLAEAKYHELDEESVVFRSIVERIEQLI